jgi:hypothetical protein
MTALLTHFGHWLQPERRQAHGPAPKPRWMVLSQITENRKVEARKSLIFQHTIFAFGLKKVNLRQNRVAWW